MRTRKLVLAIAAGTMLVFVLGGAIVFAANVQRGKGSMIDRVKTAHTNVHSTVTDGTLDVPGARHSLILTQPSTLVVARFHASTSCSSPTAGGCHADVVILDNRNGDAFLTQMGPVGHMDSARPGDDALEGHAIEQSITLPPGDYDFQVRLQTFGAGDPVTFDIAQWHFTVERIVD